VLAEIAFQLLRVQTIRDMREIQQRQVPKSAFSENFSAPAEVL
jgi:hypothetical protein